MAYATLANIRQMVRDLTHSPQEEHLSTSDIDDRINTYMIKDMPLELRTFSLATQLEFFTQPYVAEYGTSTTLGDPLYNFKNKYLNIYGPVTFNGYAGSYMQDPVSFAQEFNYYAPPIDTLLRGNGTAGAYTGNMSNFASLPVIPNNVMFNTLDANGNAMVLKDFQQSSTYGILATPVEAGHTPVPVGYVYYVTGAFSLMFPNVVPSGNIIYANFTPYKPGRPYSMLYFDTKFTIRPIPDGVYRVKIQADIKPSALLTSTSVPYETMWWELIAFGAAIKVAERRTDPDLIALLESRYQREFNKVMSQTALQIASQRPATYWTQMKNIEFNFYPPYRPY